MKVLSLKQPWAELILQGKKKIELRNWNTKFRGKFLIHSSKVPDKEAMKKFGFGNLDNGFLVGEAELVDVKRYENDKEFEADKNLHFAISDFGKYGFILKNIRRIKIRKAKGQLGFWDYNLV
jgi:hypothetical protein